MVLSEMPELCSWCEGEVDNKSSLIFPKLKTLEVINCPKLIAMSIVPSLKSMIVKGNKNLSCFASGLTTLHNLSLESHGRNESLSFKPWESLNELFLGNYNSIVPVGAKEGEESITPTKCQRLEISKLFPSNMSLWFWKCFTFLEKLEIRECNNLIYWPEEVFKSLNCLRYIHVFNCPNYHGTKLESTIGRPFTEVLLPILEDLYIQSCPNLVKIPKCSLSTRHLLISNCSKLQCLPEWMGSMIALRRLQIWNCESLNSLPLSMGGLTSLEDLSVISCPNLACLPEGMEGLKALEQLTIEMCPKIRVLPESIFQQLNYLWIKDCPHLERQFRKYGKYQNLIADIPVTIFGEERRSDILKNLAVSFPPCKITCFPAGS